MSDSTLVQCSEGEFSQAQIRDESKPFHHDVQLVDATTSATSGTDTTQAEATA